MFDDPFNFGAGDNFTPDFSAADTATGGQIPSPLPEQVAQFLATKNIAPQDFMANPEKFTAQAPIAFDGLSQHGAGLGAVLGASGGNAGADLGLQPTPVKTTSYTQPPSESAEAMTVGGRSAAPQPAPIDTAPASGDTTTVSAGGTAKAVSPSDRAQNLIQGLRGVQAPAAPVAQKVSTPSVVAPHLTNNVKGGNLAALLQILAGGANPQQQKVPLPLGAVLGGRV